MGWDMAFRGGLIRELHGLGRLVVVLFLVSAAAHLDFSTRQPKDSE
jgi:hypothetical protein